MVGAFGEAGGEVGKRGREVDSFWELESWDNDGKEDDAVVKEELLEVVIVADDVDDDDDDEENEEEEEEEEEEVEEVETIAVEVAKVHSSIDTTSLDTSLFMLVAVAVAVVAADIFSVCEATPVVEWMVFVLELAVVRW